VKKLHFKERYFGFSTIFGHTVLRRACLGQGPYSETCRKPLFSVTQNARTAKLALAYDISYLCIVNAFSDQNISKFNLPAEDLGPML
jgi:hypothetical protein